MFGHNPVMQNTAVESDEAKKLRQQMDEMLSIKPETVLEKILMKENIALKAEVESLKKQIEDERVNFQQRITLADQIATDRTSRIYQSHMKLYW